MNHTTEILITEDGTFYDATALAAFARATRLVQPATKAEETAEQQEAHEAYSANGQQIIAAAQRVSGNYREQVIERRSQLWHDITDKLATITPTYIAGDEQGAFVGWKFYSHQPGSSPRTFSVSTTFSIYAGNAAKHPEVMHRLDQLMAVAATPNADQTQSDDQPAEDHETAAAIRKNLVSDFTSLLPDMIDTLHIIAPPADRRIIHEQPSTEGSIGLLRNVARLANGYQDQAQQASAELDLYNLSDELHANHAIEPSAIEQSLQSQVVSPPNEPLQPLQELATMLADSAASSQQAKSHSYRWATSRRDFDLTA